MFHDRTDAGKQLGIRLLAYQDKQPIILGILRGGAEVGFQAARVLKADYSVIAVKKLPYPENPEAGYGSVAEDGSMYLLPGACDRLPPGVIGSSIRRQRTEAARQVDVMREGLPLPVLENRHVILVDDGIAMGSTAHAAIKCCRNRKAGKVILAAPVTSPGAKAALDGVADDVVTVLTPPAFLAVAEFYRRWHDVSDQEVLATVEAARTRGILAAA